jgi:hypothetical protein
LQGITGLQGTTGPRGPTGPAGYAPWINNGNDIFYNTGKVGIGLSSVSTSDIPGALTVSTNAPNTRCIALRDNQNPYGSIINVIGNCQFNGAFNPGTELNDVLVLLDTFSGNPVNSNAGLFIGPHSTNSNTSYIRFKNDNITIIGSGQIVQTKIFDLTNNPFTKGPTGTSGNINSNSTTTEQTAAYCLFTPINTIGRTSDIICQCFYRWYTSGSAQDTFAIILRGGNTTNSFSNNPYLDVSTPTYVSASGGGGRETARPFCGQISTTDTSQIRFDLTHYRQSSDDWSNIDLTYTKFIIQQIIR